MSKEISKFKVFNTQFSVKGKKYGGPYIICKSLKQAKRVCKDRYPYMKILGQVMDGSNHVIIGDVFPYLEKDYSVNNK